MREKLGLLGCLAALGVLLLCSADTARAVREGLALCAGSVIPALFPFLAVSGLLTALDAGAAPGRGRIDVYKRQAAGRRCIPPRCCPRRRNHSPTPSAAAAPWTPRGPGCAAAAPCLLYTSWFAIGYQCGFAYLISLMINQFGGLFTGSVNVIGLIFALAALALMVYMLVRPYKEATKLNAKV